MLLAWKVTMKRLFCIPLTRDINVLQTDHIHIMERCHPRKAEGQKTNQAQLNEMGSPALEHQGITSIWWKTLLATELSRDYFLLSVPHSPAVNKRFLVVNVGEQKLTQIKCLKSGAESWDRLPKCELRKIRAWANTQEGSSVRVKAVKA